MNFYGKKTQSKLTKVLLTILVIMLAAGLLLPSFMGAFMFF